MTSPEKFFLFAKEFIKKFISSNLCIKSLGDKERIKGLSTDLSVNFDDGHISPILSAESGITKIGFETSFLNLSALKLSLTAI